DSHGRGEADSLVLNRSGRPHAADRVSTLEDPAVKQPLRERRCDQGRYAGTASGLAKDGDTRGVAAEARDVALHPLQGRDLIENGVVARRASRPFSGERRMRQESENAESIVERDDDGALLRETCTVMSLLTTEARVVATAIDPDHHGTLD